MAHYAHGCNTIIWAERDTFRCPSGGGEVAGRDGYGDTGEPARADESQPPFTQPAQGKCTDGTSLQEATPLARAAMKGRRLAGWKVTA